MPTCGPLPWETTTLVPSWIMSTMCLAVFRTSVKLLLRGVAQGVAAQGDDSGLAVALFVSHRFHLNLSVNQPISLLGCM